MCHSLRTLGKGIELEHPHGAVPDDGLCALQRLDILLRCLCAAVECLPAVGDLVHVDRLRVGIRRKLIRNDDIDRQDNLHALLLRLLKQFLCEADLVALAERIADRVSL